MLKAHFNSKEKLKLNEMFETTNLDAYKFHQSLPEYCPTPLYQLKELAHELGIKSLLVKDESQRFDLKAFKILGAAWAMAKSLADYYQYDMSDITLWELQSKLVEKEPLTFVTATDGNHGRGVARAARWLGQEAVVYLPHGAANERLNAALSEGAKAEILLMNYDDAVRYASKMASDNNWILIQDTALENYENIPQLIMQGYETIVHEISSQLKELPTHIILQAGVGSFAASFIGAFIRQYKYLPIFIIVEPDEADCYFISAKSNKEKPQVVTGMLKTIMAGLACGEPNPLAYDLIMRAASCFFSVDDEIAKIGIKKLARPIGSDPKIVAGESGSVGVGLITQLMLSEKYTNLRKELFLDSESKVLCINTEGDTDSYNYLRIINEK